MFEIEGRGLKVWSCGLKISMAQKFLERVACVLGKEDPSPEEWPVLAEVLERQSAGPLSSESSCPLGKTSKMQCPASVPRHVRWDLEDLLAVPKRPRKAQEALYSVPSASVTSLSVQASHYLFHVDLSRPARPAPAPPFPFALVAYPVSGAPEGQP